MHTGRRSHCATIRSSTSGSRRSDGSQKTRHSTRPGRAKEAYYHWKSPELLEANSSGLVPTLVEKWSNKAITESINCIQYVDELAQARGSSAPAPLLPADPAERSRNRLWAERVNKRCCSPYYGVLVRTDDAGRREAHASLLAGLREFSAELVAGGGGGPFFNGKHTGLVDLTLLPWAWRFYVLPHYRGADFDIPKTDDLAPFHAYLEAMLAQPYVQETLPDSGRYLEHIAKYATSSARSKVANAVRRGVAAHDLDDELDGESGAEL